MSEKRVHRCVAVLLICIVICYTPMFKIPKWSDLAIFGRLESNNTVIERKAIGFYEPIHHCNNRTACVYSGNLSATLNRRYGSTDISPLLQSQRNALLASVATNWKASTSILMQREHILISWIPKNSCTQLKRLAAMMHEDVQCWTDILNKYEKNVNIHSPAFKPAQRHKTVADDWRSIVSSDDWYAIVVIRDPLERFVSGFLDKCCRGVGTYSPCKGLLKMDAASAHDCAQSDECRQSMFVQLANEMYRLHKSNKSRSINDHFRPQSYFHGLDHNFGALYDFIIIYSRDTFGLSVEWVLQQMNQSHWFYNRWGDHCNQSMLDVPTQHTTAASDHISQYITADIAVTLCQVFERDYRTFPFLPPNPLCQQH